MWKILSLATVLSAILMAFFPKASMSDSPETTSPIEANAVDDSLVCYMVTSDGRTLNLNSICGSTDRTQQSSSNAAHTRPSGNLGGLDIFGRGADAPPCFGLDDNGQPCPSSTNP